MAGYSNDSEQVDEEHEISEIEQTEVPENYTEEDEVIIDDSDSSSFSYSDSDSTSSYYYGSGDSVESDIEIPEYDIEEDVPDTTKFRTLNFGQLDLKQKKDEKALNTIENKTVVQHETHVQQIGITLTKQEDLENIEVFNNCYYFTCSGDVKSFVAHKSVRLRFYYFYVKHNLS